MNVHVPVPIPVPVTTSCSRIRRYWTDEEDRVLRHEANIQLKKRGAVKQWNLIASKLEGRTNKDCRKRWNKVGRDVNKGPWSRDEDDRLRGGVEKHDTCWTLVAEVVRTRHADQCAKRWYDFLDPTISHKDWDGDEEMRLLAAVRIHGRSWKIIRQKQFPNRSTTDIKNRYVIMERNGKVQRSRIFQNDHHNQPHFDFNTPTSSTPLSASPIGGVPTSHEVDDFVMAQWPSPSQLTSSASHMSDDYSTTASNDGTSQGHMMLDLDPVLQIPDMLFDASTVPSTPSMSWTQSALHTPTDMAFGEDGMMNCSRAPTQRSYPTSTPTTEDSYDWGMDGFPELGHQHRQSIISSSSGMDSSSVTSAPDGSYMLVLEDLRPEILDGIMTTLMDLKSNVKMKVFSNAS